MPASPSEGRQKWRRGRVPKTSKRQRPEDEDDEEEDDDNDEVDEDEDLHPNPNPNPNPNPKPREHPEVLSGSGIRISTFPPAVKYSVKKHHRHDVNVVLENISYGQLQVLSTVPADSSALVGPDQPSSYVITPPTLIEGTGVLKTFSNARLLLPLHADWFHPTSVHRLERQAVPHFFSGKSPQHTPDKYLDSRNSIVAKYIENPTKTLSLWDCQNLSLAVDIDDLSRIYRFLDHWGIINFSAPVTPHYPSVLDNSFLREEPTGEVHVPSASLKSIDSLIKFDKPKCKLKTPDLYSSNYDDLADLDARIRERLSENHCDHCARPLLVVYYQSIKEADTLLCPDCYHESRLVVGHTSMDFTKVDTAADYGDQDGDSWTDQETLLLLEALETYNDNWNDIAEHVGTKSKSQCILHFLSLPTEDGLLENIKVPCTPTQSNGSNATDNGKMFVNANGSHAEDSGSENRFPFATSENPVMALVAFLASAVGPRIAAACAHACLAALSHDEGSLHSRVDSDEKPPETRNCSQANEENLDAQGSQVPISANQEASLPCDRVNSAAKAGLSAAAVKAKLFADHEEREIQRLSAVVVNHQLKRLELKLKQFAEVETLLMKECEQVEKTRQTLAGERTRALAGRFGAGGVAPPMNLAGVAPQIVNNNINSRPPAMSASPSQPGVSGYGGSQLSHPQVPFLTRQQMFSFGPRLPLSAIHPSSAGSSSSMMFGAQGSSQSSLNHPMLRPVSGTSSGMG